MACEALSALAGERSAIALRIAEAASEDFICESIEYPTILLEYTSLIAQVELAPYVGCSVTSVSEIWFGAPAMNSWMTPALLIDHREQVVVDGRTWLACVALAALVGDENTRCRTQSPDPVLRGNDAWADPPRRVTSP